MLTNLQATTIGQYGNGKDKHAHARQVAGKLFEKMHGRGVRNQVLAKMTGKASRLQTISRRPAASRRTTKTIVVPLSKIVGSEGRSDDFDAKFNPLKRHNRERWIGIVAARQTGVVLPAVELVRDGNRYFVRDGHHRISAAKAMGQLDIEARIMN